MKKFILIIALAVISFTSYAQLSADHKEFKLGDYVFCQKEFTYMSLYDNEYECRLDTEEEAYNLWYYIRLHRAEISKQYNVRIPSDVKSLDGSSVYQYPQMGRERGYYTSNHIYLGTYYGDYVVTIAVLQQ